MGLTYFLIILIGSSLLVFPGPTMGIVYSVPIYRSLEFFLGICTYELMLSATQKSLKILVKYIFPLASLLTIFDLGVIAQRLPLYITHDYIFCIFFSLLLIKLSLEKSRLSKVLSNSILEKLGLASYSFYTLQVFAILAVTTFHEKLLSQFPFLYNSKYLVAIIFIVLIFASLLVYKYLELPMRRLIRKKLD